MYNSIIENNAKFNLNYLVKMLDANVDTLKKISVFGQPFNIYETPYESVFSEKVIEYCSKSYLESDFKCSKVVFLGDVGVGKTSIIQRFCQDSFVTNYKPTIGVDFEVEKFEILGIPFTLQIWDTAGQEKFKSLASSYYRAAHVIVVVFDMSKMTSLANCANWLKTAMKEYENSERPYVLVIGNKTDAILPASYEKVEGYAVQMSEHLEAEFWPVSSKTGVNVSKMFLRIASLAFQSYVLKEMSKNLNNTSIGKISLVDKKSSRRQRKLHQSCKNCA